MKSHLSLCRKPQRRTSLTVAAIILSLIGTYLFTSTDLLKKLVIEPLSNRQDDVNATIHPGKSTVRYCTTSVEVLDGEWVRQKVLDPLETASIWNIIHRLRVQKGWPGYLIHGDRRCGPLYPLPRIQNNSLAITDIASQCDGDSETPCCLESQGWCGSGPKFCDQSSSVDYRLRRLPEISDWVPRSNCNVHNYTKEEACLVISQFDQVIFFGDSLARHLYTALLLKLTGDVVRGGLKFHTPPTHVVRCGYMHQFAETTCMLHLSLNWGDYQLKTKACTRDPPTLVHYVPAYRSTHIDILLNYLDSIPSNGSRIVIGGIGIHDGFHISSVVEFMERLLTRFDQYRSRLVWLTTHSTDRLKPLTYERTQGLGRIAAFNRVMTSFFRLHNTTIFDTFGMTTTAESIDGLHYGLRLNLLKVDALLLELSTMMVKYKEDAYMI